MITRFLGLTLGMVCILAASACQKVPLLAPSGSTITLTASNNAIPASGTVELIAQVLEPSGTPPHPGTFITFTTTLGVIEPAEAKTDINGRVRVTFKPNGANGTATITASSGGATTGANGAVKIAVGTAAVGRVIVNATPATISSGGRSTISASVLDVNGTPLANTLVSFSTDAGTLSTGVGTSDGAGVATTSLTTAQSATVTASVGATTPPTGNGSTTPTAQTSGTAKVTVIPATTVTITPPASAPSAGLPATFTFTVTVPTGGNPVQNLNVTWGDGTSPQSFGAVTGAQTASHVYDEPGTYTVRATAIDVAGISQSVSTTVTVIPVPRPTIIVTPTPQTVTVGGTISFNIQITTPPGIGIQNTTINFGDTTPTQSLGGASSATVRHEYTQLGTKLVTVTVLDTAGQTTEGTTSVSVTP